MLYMCQVSINCEYSEYLHDESFVCHMLWARDVSNILEYKPSLKSTGGLTENNVYPEKKYCQLQDIQMCRAPIC